MASEACDCFVHDSGTSLARKCLPIVLCVVLVVGDANGMSNFMGKNLIFTQNEKSELILVSANLEKISSIDTENIYFLKRHTRAFFKIRGLCWHNQNAPTSSI